MSHASLELDKQLCFALYRASHAVQRSYQDVLAPLRLTYPQYVTMLALWGHEDPVTMKELSAELGLDSGLDPSAAPHGEARFAHARY